MKYSTKRKLFILLTIGLFGAIINYILADIFRASLDWLTALIVLLYYSVFYFLSSLFILIGWKQARLKEQYQLDSHLQSMGDPNSCLLCNQIWGASDMIYLPWGTTRAYTTIGPLCPNCWQKLKKEFKVKYEPSWNVLGSLIVFNFAIILAVIPYSPEVGGGIYATLGWASSVIGGLLIFKWVPKIGSESPGYHIPSDAHPFGNIQAANEDLKLCTHHSHIRAIGSCPVCGDRFCPLCLLFPNIKFGRLRERMRQIYQKTLGTTRVSFRQPFAEIIPTISMLYASSTELPETNLNNSRMKSSFKSLSSLIPDQFHDLFTPSVHAMVMKIIQGSNPKARDYSPFVLACLRHNAGRAIKEGGIEKMKRGTTFTLLITTLPLIPLLLVGVFLPVFTLTITCSGVFILLFLSNRNPKIIGVNLVPEEEESLNDRIDRFLQFLNELITLDHDDWQGSPNT